MQAVILAGGLGTRLRPLTEQIPKVMVPVSGKPFLQHLIELLKSQGIGDIVLCTGYLGKQIRDLFGSGESLGIGIRYSEEKEELLGTAGALKQARSLLEDYFFVINGDTYLPVDYSGVERDFLRRNRKVHMVVYDNRLDTGVKNNVALDKDLIVIKYDKETADSDLKYVEAGVLALRREVLDLIKGDGPVSLEKGLYPLLIRQREMAAYVTDRRFYDIGTPEQRWVFVKSLKKEPK